MTTCIGLSSISPSEIFLETTAKIPKNIILPMEMLMCVARIPFGNSAEACSASDENCVFERVAVAYFLTRDVEVAKLCEDV
jgi:hypothetical protein